MSDDYDALRARLDEISHTIADAIRTLRAQLEQSEAKTHAALVAVRGVHERNEHLRSLLDNSRAQVADLTERLKYQREMSVELQEANVNLTAQRYALAKALVWAADCPMVRTLELLGTSEEEIAESVTRHLLACPEHYNDTLEAARTLSADRLGGGLMSQYVLTVAVRIEVCAESVAAAEEIGRERAKELAIIVDEQAFGAYETEFTGLIEEGPATGGK